MKKTLLPLFILFSSFYLSQTKCDKFKTFSNVRDMIELNAYCDFSVNEKYNNYIYIFEKKIEDEIKKQLPNLSNEQLTKVTHQFLKSLDVKKFSMQQRFDNTKEMEKLAKIYNEKQMYKQLKEFYGLSAFFTFESIQKSEKEVTFIYFPTIYTKSRKELSFGI